jgi:hypothetical protein
METLAARAMVRISIRSDVFSTGFLRLAFISTNRLQLHFNTTYYMFLTECLEM